MPTLAMHYLWWILALVLIAGEMLAPGYFLLWIGIASGAMGVVLFAMPGMGVMAQAILFGVFTFASCFAYWKWLRPRLERGGPSAALLNRRGEQLVGRRLVLVEPITNGRGKARVGDGAWMVAGPDLPAGTEVEVVSVSGNLLQVRPAA